MKFERKRKKEETQFFKKTDKRKHGIMKKTEMKNMKAESPSNGSHIKRCLRIFYFTDELAQFFG